MSDSLIITQLAALAEERHPASLPSRADLEATGLAGFVTRLGARTPESNVVIRVLTELEVRPQADVEQHVMSNFTRFQSEQEMKPNKRAPDETGTDDLLSPKSALRQLFTTMKNIEDDTQSRKMNLAILDRAEKFGCYLVTRAVKVVTESDQTLQETLRKPA